MHLDTVEHFAYAVDNNEKNSIKKITSPTTAAGEKTFQRAVFCSYIEREPELVNVSKHNNETHEIIRRFGNAKKKLHPLYSNSSLFFHLLMLPFRFTHCRNV